MLDGNNATVIEDNVIVGGARTGTRDWRDLDQQLRGIAKRRVALDVEEAACLMRARRMAVHRRLGMGSFLEYMERVLGYGPRVALDRLRVAEIVELFPRVRAAFAAGELPHSAVRELARVIVPETEAEWVEDVKGKSLREIEAKVSGLRKGAGPKDRPDPELHRKVLRFEVTAATYALYRDTQRALAVEAGCAMDDSTTLATMCRRALEPAASADGPTRAPYQMAVTVCEHCKRGWQDGGGQTVEITAAEVAVAECDAQRIGRLDAEAPERATQDIPPAVRRLIWRRDHGKCVVPSCRASRNIDIHHIIPREAGGSHEPMNCCLLCSGHHHALHTDGTLTITGTAPDLVITSAVPPPEAAPVIESDHDGPVRTALVELGYRRPEAQVAVNVARAHVGAAPTFDALLRASLQAARKPRPG